MLETMGSVRKIALAALVIELHDDGTYTIIKNRFSSDTRINQTVLVSEEGIVKKQKRG
ncbi:hypothetical protein LCGC14_0448880 [marine sediment metagenome]|uniref:Uncharacterized protein n=1 Tax=marine sediment metagenome TaxID=412755 RepID=A0A0F9T1J9_9ZZZZ